MTAWSSGATLGDKHKLFKKKFDQKQHFRSSLFVKGLQTNGFSVVQAFFKKIGRKAPSIFSGFSFFSS
jgi:hypothetical protein